LHGQPGRGLSQPEGARRRDNRPLRLRRRRRCALRASEGGRSRDHRAPRRPRVRRPPLHRDRPRGPQVVLRNADQEGRTGGMGRYRDVMDRTLLGEALANEPRYRARQVWEWAARGAAGYEEMTNVPTPLRARLAETVPFSTLTLEQEAHSSDGTLKALF